MKTLVLWSIRVYQKTLSPDHGPARVFYPYGCCRYYPSCSEYAHQAITLHGLSQGSKLAVKRVARCHPWAAGGYDPVPQSHTLIKKEG